MSRAIITNELEHEAALIEVGELMGASPGSSDEKRLVELFDAVMLYEYHHYPIEPPGPWWRFRYWWESRTKMHKLKTALNVLLFCLALLLSLLACGIVVFVPVPMW